MKLQTTNINQSIYPISPLSIPLPLNIFGIGFEENQNHIIRKEGFHVHQFFLCTAGKGKLIFKDKEYQIKPGEFYFLPAHIPHEYYGLDEPLKVSNVRNSLSNDFRIIFNLSSPAGKFRK